MLVTSTEVIVRVVEGILPGPLQSHAHAFVEEESGDESSLRMLNTSLIVTLVSSGYWTPPGLPFVTDSVHRF